MRGWVADPQPCPYLPDRQFTALVTVDPIAADYRALMDLGFRRSGAMAYAPRCVGCRACVPVRVDCLAFAPRRDQRRCAHRNGDLMVTWHPRGADDERRALWQCYQREIHHDSDPDDSALSGSDGEVAGGELHARDHAGRLLAVSQVDAFADALSSVYCYWDPAARVRGLGTFMALAEIAFAQATGRRWWYLGYWVAGSATMDYKGRYLPQQRWIDGAWTECADADQRATSPP